MNSSSTSTCGLAQGGPRWPNLARDDRVPYTDVSRGCVAACRGGSPWAALVVPRPKLLKPFRLLTLVAENYETRSISE